MRWYMVANSSPWDNLKYDSDGVAEVSRKFFSTPPTPTTSLQCMPMSTASPPTWRQVPLAERPETDRWILSLLNTLVGTVTEALEDYEPTRAARAINDFVCDNLSNWYVRLNRKRFWSRGCDRNNKVAAYQTLYTCLLTLSKLIAPVAPFYSDRLSTATLPTDVPERPHLSIWPISGRRRIGDRQRS